jgi:hypothetical protein
VDTFGDIARREVDLGTREHRQWNTGLAQTRVELGHERSDTRGDVLVDAVDQMWCRDRSMNAVVGDRATERDRGLPCPGTVVDSRQNMRVDVDHDDELPRWRR